MWPVREVELPGRGRGLVALRDIRAGETVLSDDPMLLFVQPGYAASVCAQCLRTLAADSAQVGCDACGACRFCSPACAASAVAPGGAHAPEVCVGLRALASSPLDAESQHLARFLLQLYSLKAAAASSQQAAVQFAAFVQLTSPVVLAESAEAQLAAVLHPLLCTVFVATGRLPAAEVTVEGAAALLAIEAANGFCIMAQPDEHGARRVRGTGIYLQSSRINHGTRSRCRPAYRECGSGCFPNVARFDYFDAAREDSTRIHFRALDPIPQGTELLMSYFPISLPRTQRQLRLQTDYGFMCTCQRCELELSAALADADGRLSDMSDSSCSSDEDSGEDWEHGGAGYSLEYSLWMLKFLCPQEECGGTLAPPHTTAEFMECNYCGYERSDAEFYAHLEQEHAGGGKEAA